VARQRPPRAAAAPAAPATAQKRPVHRSTAARSPTPRWLPVLALVLVALGLAVVVLYAAGLL
jgi:hypothetical protein